MCADACFCFHAAKLEGALPVSGGADDEVVAADGCGCGGGLGNAGFLNIEKEKKLFSEILREKRIPTSGIEPEASM